MASINEDTVLRALGSVPVPGADTDIVNAGIVAGIAIDGDRVSVSLQVDPSQGSALEPMRQAAERALAGERGIGQATVVLTAQRSGGRQDPPPAGPGGGPRAGAAPPKRMLLPGVDKVIAVASGKGGVGKSTTAVNLALAMAKLGRRVGLLDADVYGPSTPRMLNVTNKPESHDGKILEPIEAYGIKAMSIGFLVDETTPMIWRGPMVMSALEQMLRDVNWGDLDVMVVDMPPGTGDAQLTMAQRVPLAGAIIVSTPQDIALIDARKGLNMFRKTEVPCLGIVENMSHFVCPSCGHQSEIFGHGGARAEAEREGVAFLGAVPLHIDIRKTSDEGQPIVVSDPQSAHAKVYADIAVRVLDTLFEEDRHARPAPRIVFQ